jgi:L-aminopeptidase/D-esterase-like protein
MSKFKAKAKTVKQGAPEQVATPAPVAPDTGRTIVAIAKELKITPQNARRLARQHADTLGHASKGARWLLSPDQEKRVIELATTKPAAAA